MKQFLAITIMALASTLTFAQRPHQPAHPNQHRMKAPLYFQSHNKVHFTVYIDDIIQNTNPGWSVRINSEITERSVILVMVTDGDRLAGRYIHICPKDAHGTYVVVYMDNLVEVYAQAEYDELLRRGAFDSHTHDINHGIAEEIHYHEQIFTSPEEFNTILNQLKNTSFDNSRLELMRVVVAGHRFSAEQIKILTEQFSFDDNKLEFAKMAYPSCVNPQDYFVVADCLSFKSTKDKLFQFIQERHGNSNDHHDNGHGHSHGQR